MRLVKEVESKEPKGIHLLVNNAGIARDDNTKYSNGSPDFKVRDLVLFCLCSIPSVTSGTFVLRFRPGKYTDISVRTIHLRPPHEIRPLSLDLNLRNKRNLSILRLSRVSPPPVQSPRKHSRFLTQYRKHHLHFWGDERFIQRPICLRLLQSRIPPSHQNDGNYIC